jgi:DNA-binding transcriptional regulator YdaS (Cro superfamily)
MSEAALNRAIEKIGLSQLAKVIGVTPQAISQWDKVPPLRVLDVERATGVPRHELRPDMYPPPLSVPAAAPSPETA